MTNYDLLVRVCREITPLLDQLVLVGGCATGLLITDLGAPKARTTEDVDMLVEAVSLGKYYQTGKFLKSLGFKENMEVICRWEKQGMLLDLMPVDKNLLGFGNIWYPETIKSKSVTQLEDMTLYHISSPCFLATKLEAFTTRGNDDYWMSHDLEDIISVIDGRERLLKEVHASSFELRSYLQKKFSQFLEDDNFLDALPGHLPPDEASQKRLNSLRGKLEKLAALEVIRT